MKRIALFSIILSIFLFMACDKSNPQPDRKELKPIKMSHADASVVEASNQFGFEMMNELKEQANVHKNMLISPLSISYALGMTYNGAAGDTKAEMAACMNLESLPLQEVNSSFQYLTEALMNVDEKVHMEIANSIWYRKSFQVQDDFIQTNSKYYNALVSSLDFSSPDASSTINNWVSDATNGKIDRIVGQISPLDMMFLINAIYFKGQWRHEFEKNKTTGQVFYLRNGEEVQVPTMQVESKFRYFENDYCSAVEMPYGRGNFSMVLMLPEENLQPEDVISQLASGASLSEELEQADSTSVQVYLPKFTFSYEQAMNGILKSLGMEKAFDPHQANFTKINPEVDDLHVSSVKHKSFIEVNEEGTEAAAVTSVTVGVTSAGPSGYVLRFNRPFVFAIREQSTETILFSGIVETP